MGAGGGASGGSGGGGGSCTPESDLDLCTRQQRMCSGLYVTDNCGATRSVLNCGSCLAPLTCSVEGVCCLPETPLALCARLSRDCGSLTHTDNCGTTRTVSSCGTCAAALVCGTAGLCCAPETNVALCAAAGRSCGRLVTTDRCGLPRSISSCGHCNSLDPAFGDGGIAGLELPSEWYANSVHALGDGGILVGGIAGTSGAIWLRRLRPNGGVDPGFGDAGWVVLDLGDQLASPRWADLPQEKLAVASSRSAGGSARQPVLYRLNANGSVDSTFADAGHFTGYSTSTLTGTLGVATNAAGELLLQHGPFPLRLDAAGTVVGSFGSNGSLLFQLPAVYASDSTIPSKLYVPSGVRFLADAGIRAIGSVTRTQGSGDFGVSMAQYTNAGVYDPDFGDAGIQISQAVIDSNYDLRRDGKILTDGSAYQLFARYLPGTFTGTLFRHRPNGTLDPSYGMQGRASIVYEPDFVPYDLEPVGVKATRGGLAVALFFGGPRGNVWPLSFLVTRRTLTGQADVSFPLGGRGDGWVELTEAENTWRDFSVNFDVDPDDSVLVVASFRRAPGAPVSTYLYRLKP